MHVRTWTFVLLLLALMASACTTESASSTPSTAPPEMVPPETAPPALAAVTPENVTIELPLLEPYGPGEANPDLGWLADQAALVALDHVGTSNPEPVLELANLPVLADRVALGLDQLGLAFSRSNGPDAAGNYGTIITVHDNPTASLARWERFDSSSIDGAASVRQQTLDALRTEVDVPHEVGVIDLSAREHWRIARSADPSLLATELIGEPARLVAWSNREAQRYVPDAVTFSDEGFTLDTTSRSTAPSVTELPYDSGMVITDQSFGWSTISATIDLPIGDGLWPAIWLLDDEACEAPGRCLGYESPAYHEIDLVELRTQQPNEAHVSVHWWGERVRSESSIAPIASSELTIELERRPGLLIWRIDDEVVKVLTGRVESLDNGAHREAPMKLIVNTAVGGSFSGEQEVGRDGEWLGEALVPASYPSSLNTTFTVHHIELSAH